MPSVRRKAALACMVTFFVIEEKAMLVDMLFAGRSKVEDR
jgi:hypothetical protein